MKQVRKDVARFKTEIRSREIAAAEALAAESAALAAGSAVLAADVEGGS
jgi:hypothetical protein